MKKSFFYILILLGAVNLTAQNVDKYDNEDQLVFEKEWTIGGLIHTNGWGIDYTTMKYKNATKKTLWQIGLKEIKDPAEKKTQSLYSTTEVQLKGYFFAKQNKFYTLDALYGVQKTIAGKGRKGAVEVAWTYKGGLTLGIAKPYYILSYFGDGDYRDIKYSGGGEDDMFLNESAIIAGSSFFKGFSFKEMSFYPGLFGQVAIIFDWASHQEFVKSIELGFQNHLFYKRVPIMVTQQNHLWHPNVYLKINLGRRN